MQANNQDSARIEKIKRWSPVWIVPVVTLVIGGWILYWHYSQQGPEVELITTNAEGIVAGKTAIKSRSVDVGVVSNVVLSDDLHHVDITARLNSGMSKLLKSDTVFWVVKPTIGRSGVSGLGTLLSGVYIELRPGRQGEKRQQYQLLNAPPLAPLDAKGIRVIVDSEKAGQLDPGDPVLFRGYRVGYVEMAKFDAEKRMMTYQLFIEAPYDRLVTTNVRFWNDSGIAVDFSASGMRVDVGSLTTLLSGGVSFDTPYGRKPGPPAKNLAEYRLFDNQRSIQDSIYNVHKDYLMFFNESIRGLKPGAPVEFRGIRLGTVAEAPFRFLGEVQRLEDDYRIPVLVRIEPDRFQGLMGKGFNFEKRLTDSERQGLRGSLKTANLLTGALYVDLDFYRNDGSYKRPRTVAGYEVIATTSGGFNQIQQKLVAVLDKINQLPLNQMVGEVNMTLKESQSSLRELQRTLVTLNQLVSSEQMQKLPSDLQKTLLALNRSLKGVQPGSLAYDRIMGDMQRLEQVLRELQPLLRTLNTKSNALVFEAKPGQDPKPGRIKQ